MLQKETSSVSSSSPSVEHNPSVTPKCSLFLHGQPNIPNRGLQPSSEATMQIAETPAGFLHRLAFSSVQQWSVLSASVWPFHSLKIAQTRCCVRLQLRCYHRRFQVFKPLQKVSPSRAPRNCSVHHPSSRGFNRFATSSLAYSCVN